MVQKTLEKVEAAKCEHERALAQAAADVVMAEATLKALSEEQRTLEQTAQQHEDIAATTSVTSSASSLNAAVEQRLPEHLQMFTGAADDRKARTTFERERAAVTKTLMSQVCWMAPYGIQLLWYGRGIDLKRCAVQMKQEHTAAVKARNSGSQALSRASGALQKARSKEASAKAACEKARAVVDAARSTVTQRQQGLHNHHEQQQLAALQEQRKAEALEQKRYPMDDQALLFVRRPRVCPGLLPISSSVFCSAQLCFPAHLFVGATYTALCRSCRRGVPVMRTQARRTAVCPFRSCH